MYSVIISRIQRPLRPASVFSMWCDDDVITPVLCDLHWLPVRHRIDFKVAMTVFKCIHGLAPQYLADDCVLASTMRMQSTTFAVRWHHETGGAADKDRHRHQGLCSRCCYCMEQITSWHSNFYVHGSDICTETENFYASRRIWGFFILRGRNWLIIIIIIIIIMKCIWLRI